MTVAEFNERIGTQVTEKERKQLDRLIDEGKFESVSLAVTDQAQMRLSVSLLGASELCFRGC